MIRKIPPFQFYHSKILYSGRHEHERSEESQPLFLDSLEKQASCASPKLQLPNLIGLILFKNAGFGRRSLGREYQLKLHDCKTIFSVR